VFNLFQFLNCILNVYKIELKTFVFKLSLNTNGK
jgi:hypothetical protein